MVLCPAMVLQELGIKFEQYEHPAVLTVEAQEKYVGDKGGGLRENLFLKDKKSRFYIFSALAGAKVDMIEAWFGERGHKNGSGRRIRTATSDIQARDLDKFLKSIGREPSYSYLEANPPVGKDQPLDLAIFVPSCTIDVPDALESSTPSQFVSESSLPIQKKSTPASGTCM
ncbi:unnamed protein product [Linum tenue]|uniref:Uncharacterized protein n=1 Tax=Linum tenue TaxID=586396 RepID=A0AAV0RVL7_9ROSI|nr:unnamed protein product [Linum tenue]